MDTRRFAVFGFITGYLMKGMNGDKNHILILVFQFHHIVPASLIIRYFYQTTENTDPIIYMNDIITDGKARQIIDGQLFTLIDGPA